MKLRIPPSHNNAGDFAASEALAPGDGLAPKTVIHINSSQFQVMLAEIATNAWKAQLRLRMWPNEELPTERRRLERNIEAIVNSLQEFGVRVKDHTGEAYDYGQPIKVVASQPQAGIAREVVTETIRPSVYWAEHILQRGEVMIATPVEVQD